MKTSHRREFLTTTAGWVAGMAYPLSRLGAAEAGPSSEAALGEMRIGILLNTYRGRTLAERLDAAQAHGLRCAQISYDCAGLPSMPETIDPDVPVRIRREAAAREIELASVQGTFNMTHPEAGHRRAGLRRLRVLAESCASLRVDKVHLCSGTRDRASMWRNHPDNDTPEAWRDMTACMREAAEIAREFKLILAVEPEVNNVVNSAKKARQLMDEIGSPHLKVTLDAANLFHTGDLPRMKEVLEECFALIGNDIVLAHAKDLDRDGDAGHLPAGHGKLDYDRYLALLRKHRFTGPLLLHSLSPAQVPGCVNFLREKMARAES